jgi:hypothetical protein
MLTMTMIVWGESISTIRQCVAALRRFVDVAPHPFTLAHARPTYVGGDCGTYTHRGPAFVLDSHTHECLHDVRHHAQRGSWSSAMRDALTRRTLGNHNADYQNQVASFSITYGDSSTGFRSPDRCTNRHERHMGFASWQLAQESRCAS